MMNNKPDSKDYKRTSLNHNYSFRLPYAVKKDFDKYLKAFPNTNKGMLEIIIDVLNSKVFERKYYNIDVVSIFPNAYDEEESKIGCFLSSTDNYLIEREQLTNIPSSSISNNKTYLNPSKELSLEEFSTKLNKNHFTDSGILPIDFIYLEGAIEDYYHDQDFHFEDYSLVMFKVNNYLDEFIENEYQLPNGNHKGIGYFIPKYYDVPSYFVYEWKFNEDLSFELLNVELIDEDRFKSYIVNSSNDKLNLFLKDFIQNNVPEEEAVVDVSEILEQYKRENRELMKERDRIKKNRDSWKEQYEKLKNANDSLKEQHEKYLTEIDISNKKTEKVDELTKLVKQIMERNQN